MNSVIVVLPCFLFSFSEDFVFRSFDIPIPNTYSILAFLHASLYPFVSFPAFFHSDCGWSGGVMALSKLPVPGRPTIWMIVGQGPTALAAGAGGGCLDI